MNDCNCTDQQVERVLISNPGVLEAVVFNILKRTEKFYELKERLNSEEAAEFLNIATSTLANKCSAREIPYSKPGGKNREFKLDDLKVYRHSKEKVFQVI